MFRGYNSQYLVTLYVAVDNTALNVVCNQEYAQVVPHVRRPLYFTILTPPNPITGRSTTT